MNGFLVLGRCPSDDIPLRFVVTFKEANVVAAHTTEDEIIAEALRGWGVRVRQPIATDIVEFTNGKPGRIVRVVDYII